MLEAVRPAISGNAEIQRRLLHVGELFQIFDGRKFGVFRSHA